MLYITVTTLNFIIIPNVNPISFGYVYLSIIFLC